MKISAIALYGKCARLRAEGKSLSEIGQKVSLTKQRVHQILRDGPASSKSSIPASSRASSGLTVRERGFVQGLAEGKSQTQAAIDAGAPERSAANWANRALKRDDVQEVYQELLDRILPEDLVLRVHRENLRATRTLIATHEGRITDKDVVPDYQARQRAVDTAYDLRGRRQQAPTPPSVGQLAILIGLPRAVPIPHGPASDDEPEP